MYGCPSSRPVWLLHLNNSKAIHGTHWRDSPAQRRNACRKLMPPFRTVYGSVFDRFIARFSSVCHRLFSSLSERKIGGNSSVKRRKRTCRTPLKTPQINGENGQNG